MELFFRISTTILFIMYDRSVLSEYKGCTVRETIYVFLNLLLIASEDVQLQALYLFLSCMFWKDALTCYLSRAWIVFSLILFLFLYREIPFLLSVCGALSYGLPALLLYRKNREWIGSADVLFLFFFGFLLGLYKMAATVLISVLSGLIWIAVSGKSSIPYLSCLSIGVWIAWSCGDGLWAYFSI